MTKERPILFSGVMVRAILDGRKTQTRRAVKPQPDMSLIRPEYQHPNLWEFRKRFMSYEDGWSGHEHAFLRQGDPSDMPVWQHRSPNGEPGDRLWVRETWGYNPDFPGMPSRACYRADPGHEYDGIRWKPSIHMPRAACRIVLEIIGVRIERLSNCRRADAIAEGAPPSHSSIDRVSRQFGYEDFSRSWYAQLWDSINGPGAWEANPWVWVFEFRRVGGQ